MPIKFCGKEQGEEDEPLYGDGELGVRNVASLIFVSRQVCTSSTLTTRQFTLGRRRVGKATCSSDFDIIGTWTYEGDGIGSPGLGRER